MILNDIKLKVNFINPITSTIPIENRKYTFAYSNEKNLFILDVGNFYNYKMVDFTLRNEILGKWILESKNNYTLLLYINLKGYDTTEINQKYKIFKENLSLAIHKILLGDILLIKTHPYLINSPIYVHFSSAHFMFNSVEYYKTPSFYLDTF